MNDVVKVINHIKAHAINSRMFEQLCEEMDAENRRLLLHAEIRWIPREIAIVTLVPFTCVCHIKVGPPSFDHLFRAAARV